MGALTYKPEHKFESSEQESDYDKLAQECSKILESQDSSNLDELFKLGGSSGGARPKILTKINGEDWIIKFPSSQDPKNIGEQEYKYSLVAKDCGIKMTETRLFDSKICSGYFGIKRFDIVDNKKLYVISMSSLLNKNPFTTVFTYKNLFKITSIMTNSSLEDLEQLYRIMVFNYLAGNQDDHAKNFSFIYNEDLRKWELSPAYDLTLSHTQYGEHQILVGDKGQNVSKDDLINEALGFGLKKEFLAKTYDEIEKIVKTDLNSYI